MIDGQTTVSPNPEVTPKAKRRSFNASYKKKILAEVEAATGTGSIGEILRREGIYSSTLTSWRKERDAVVDGAFSKKRGPAPAYNPFTAENEKLRRQNQRLQEELRKAEIIIEVQKNMMSGCTPWGMKITGPERLQTASRRSKLTGVGGARSKATLEKP